MASEPSVGAELARDEGDRVQLEKRSVCIASKLGSHRGCRAMLGVSGSALEIDDVFNVGKQSDVLPRHVELWRASRLWEQSLLAMKATGFNWKNAASASRASSAPTGCLAHVGYIRLALEIDDVFNVGKQSDVLPRHVELWRASRLWEQSLLEMKATGFN